MYVFNIPTEYKEYHELNEQELEDGASDIDNAYGYHNATVDPRNI